jgi:hypothetical protein
MMIHKRLKKDGRGFTYNGSSSKSSRKMRSAVGRARTLKIGICNPVKPDLTVIHSRKLKCTWDVGAWMAKPKNPARPVRAQSYSEMESPCVMGGTICATASPTLHKIPPVTILVGIGLAWSLDSYHATNVGEAAGVAVVGGGAPPLLAPLKSRLADEKRDDRADCEFVGLSNEEGASVAGTAFLKPSLTPLLVVVVAVVVHILLCWASCSGGGHREPTDFRFVRAADATDAAAVEAAAVEVDIDTLSDVHARRAPAADPPAAPTAAAAGAAPREEEAEDDFGPVVPRAKTRAKIMAGELLRCSNRIK